jgi:hypothetical protein
MEPAFEVVEQHAKIKLEGMMMLVVVVVVVVAGPVKRKRARRRCCLCVGGMEPQGLCMCMRG